MSDSPLTLTAGELHAETRREFPSAYVLCLDATYNVPKVESLGIWGTWSRERLAMFGVAAWKTFFDCDKFSLFFKVMAALMHYAAWAFNRATAQGVAVGVLIYDIGGQVSRRHMINVVRTRNGIEKYEPQTQRIVTLNTEEKQCASFVLW